MTYDRRIAMIRAAHLRWLRVTPERARHLGASSVAADDERDAVDFAQRNPLSSGYVVGVEEPHDDELVRRVAAGQVRALDAARLWGGL